MNTLQKVYFKALTQGVSGGQNIPLMDRVANQERCGCLQSLHTSEDLDPAELRCEATS